MNNYLLSFKKRTFYIIALLCLSFLGCKKSLQIDPPVNSVNAQNIFLTDKTAEQAITGLYATLSAENTIPTNFVSSVPGVFFAAGLSSDELILFNKNDATRARYYTNSLTELDYNSWNSLYNYILRTNAAIEGLQMSSILTPSIKAQLLGEAKFFRAFCYFYLVNLYGEVPLALQTDPEINRLLYKSSKALVYAQIISDLKEAEAILSSQFMNESLTNSSTERVRPNRWAAKALLSRAYLYNSEFASAEAKASEVIGNTELFSLMPVNQVFLKNSRETIWALQPVRADLVNGYNTGESALFILPATGPNTADSQPSYPVYLSNSVVNSFEPGDARASNWLSSVSQGTNVYNFAYKYKAPRTQTTVTEYSIVLRLSEQYLIRAEAKIRQGGTKVVEGISDLNILRFMRRNIATTAVPNPLPDLSPSQSQLQAFQAIEHERQTEFFTEWGHRWLDLKRTPGFTNPSSTRADEVMPSVTQSKGGNWNANWKLYPIPQSERRYNPNLTGAQNLGY